MVYCFCCWALFVATLTVVVCASARTTQLAQDYPAHLPYRFSNFVWWSNDELRDLLKTRIPGLGGEIAPSSATEREIRDALKLLLKARGIVA